MSVSVSCLKNIFPLSGSPTRLDHEWLLESIPASSTCGDIPVVPWDGGETLPQFFLLQSSGAAVGFPF